MYPHPAHSHLNSAHSLQVANKLQFAPHVLTVLSYSATAKYDRKLLSTTTTPSLMSEGQVKPAQLSVRLVDDDTRTEEATKVLAEKWASALGQGECLVRQYVTLCAYHTPMKEVPCTLIVHKCGLVHISTFCSTLQTRS